MTTTATDRTAPGTRAARLLPPAGAPRNLAFAQLANSVGDGAFIVTSALFFTRVVGLSTAQVGLGLTIAWLIGFLTGVPIGHLADRKGPRVVAILLALSTSASVASFLFVRSFPLFLAAAIAYAISQTGLTAARQALLAGLICGVCGGLSFALIQSATAPGYLGRVTSVMSLTGFGLAPLAYPLVGLAIASFGSAPVFLASTALGMLGGLVGLLTPALRSAELPA